MNFAKDMDNEKVENILKNEDKEKAVQSVLTLEEKDDISGHINYGSTFSRLVVKVILGNRKTSKKSLILKKPLPGENNVAKEDILNLFKTETLVNVSVLKEIGYLMEDFDDTNDIFWCKLLHHEEYTTLLFEDLEAKGFKHISWNFNLDTDHCVLVLKNLGRFHGMCKVLEERGVITKEDYPSSCHFFSDKNFINNFFNSGFQVLRRGMMKYWGISWESVAERLKVPSDLIEKRLFEIGELSEARFNVLNHGDCWINNTMFKYDLDNRPYTMRFLNFQRPFYNSPCLDITFFMYMSIDAGMRRNHFDRLLKAYYDSLIETLKKYGYEGKKPTYEDISSDMDRVSFFGLCIFLVQHPMLTGDKVDVSDIEQLYAVEGKSFRIEMYKSKSLIDKMIPDLINFIQMAGL